MLAILFSTVGVLVGSPLANSISCFKSFDPWTKTDTPVIGLTILYSAPAFSSGNTKALYTCLEGLGNAVAWNCLLKGFALAKLAQS
jgi:hypothetical protein